jgi:glycosyltransferase involved in cell wall biosynthesis
MAAKETLTRSGMRIAQVSTLATRVAAAGAGSIESIVYSLAVQLTHAGHEVTVFAAAGSTAPCEVVETLPGTYGRNGAPPDWHLCEMANLCAAVERSDEFDVIHSHAYLWGIPFQRIARCPMAHTLHVAAYHDSAALWRLSPDARVTALSEWQWRGFPSLTPAAVIPHGVDETQHTFRPGGGAYACFLGRFIPGKGVLRAIAAARALDLRLLLAGPRNEYYDLRVAPEVDGRGVEYVGPVEGADRDALLGDASVLLYPVEQPEPFGLVLIEAMASGTPVAAHAIGAAPEIVDEGLTGFTVTPNGDFEGAVRNALTLDRTAVRARAVARFSAREMAARYIEVYERAALGVNAR